MRVVVDHKIMFISMHLMYIKIPDYSIHSEGGKGGKTHSEGG